MAFPEEDHHVSRFAFLGDLFSASQNRHNE
jgi:hypothetical protein